MKYLDHKDLVSVGAVDDIGGLARIMSCRMSYLPMKYLGLLLGASFKAKSIWDGISDKMLCRLAGWKRPYLSKGGRLTLIKSSLSNLPTFYLSIFPILVGVANRLEKLQRDFLWGRVGEELKFHLVHRSKICTLISLGRLGV